MATSENKTAAVAADMVFAYIRNIVCFLLLDECWFIHPREPYRYSREPRATTRS
jgi:hypothetical protein